MKRELLLEKIEEYKSLMPWFVLEYYQSNYRYRILSRPYMNISRNINAFLTG